MFYLIFKLTTKLGVYRSIVNTESLLSIDLLITLDQFHLFKGRIIPQAESPQKKIIFLIIDHFIRNIRRYVLLISPISEGVFKIVWQFSCNVKISRFCCPGNAVLRNKLIKKNNITCTMAIHVWRCIIFLMKHCDKYSHNSEAEQIFVKRYLIIFFLKRIIITNVCMFI